MKKDKPLNEKRFGLGKNVPEAIINNMFFYYEEDVAKAVKKSEERILDLSILEINKDLNVSEVVEKTLDIIKEEFGEFTPNHSQTLGEKDGHSLENSPDSDT